MPLPDIQFAPTETRAIEAAVITGFERAAQLAGQTDFRLSPGDPRRLFLQAVALMILQQNALIDKTGKGNLLRYAGEDTIEDIGWLYGPRGDRLQASAAVTTIQFSLSTTRPTVTTILSGTRLAAGNLIFATVENLDIPAGSLTGAITARCGVTGPDGNGFLPGQINTLVDRNPFVDTAVNVTESAGGADIEDLEAYRLRIRNAPESFSVAGPDGAYAFWAKTASADIIDVAVWMPPLDASLFRQFLTEIFASVSIIMDITEEIAKPWKDRFNALCIESGTGPGNVNVVPLLTGGKIPTQEIKDAVLSILTDNTRRPLTDFVHVLDPAPVWYDISATYWIAKDDAADSVAIQAAVTEAVEGYRLWQRSRLGLDILPSELHRRMMNAGARRVVIESPVYTVLEQGQIAQDGAVNILYGGLEHA